MTEHHPLVLRQREHARKAKPGTNMWILSSPVRAKMAGKRIEEKIPDTLGFKLITQPSGAQSWAFRYRRPYGGKVNKLTIGKVDQLAELLPDEEPEFDTPLSLNAARTLAEDCARTLRRKIDPETLKQKQRQATAELQGLRMDGILFDTVVVEFMRKYPLIRGKRKARESSQRGTATFLGLKPDGKGGWTATGNGVLSKWKGKIFADHNGTSLLTKKDAYAILDGMEDRPIAANRTLTALKLFGSWAEDRDYVTVNPFATMKKRYEENERSRILDADEITALWQAVTTAKPAEAIGYPYGRIAQFVLVTGQRPGEVREAAWAEFDFAEREWTIPGERTKNGKPHVVPLSQLALQLIAGLPDRGDFLFMAEGSRNPVHKQSRVKTRLDMRVGELLGRVPQHWTYHDLRHTAYSGITALHFTYIDADKVVNHAPPAMAKVYDQYDYYNEKWQALDAWAKHLEVITAGQSNIPETADCPSYQHA